VRVLEFSGQFARDIKLAKKRGKNMDKLRDIIQLLCDGHTLPVKFKDHPLKGNWFGCRDLHIEPDWLLIYKIDENSVRFERTGSHSDLFG
jgi:mRNA interferase YafQ